MKEIKIYGCSCLVVVSLNCVLTELGYIGFVTLFIAVMISNSLSEKVMWEEKLFISIILFSLYIFGTSLNSELTIFTSYSVFYFLYSNVWSNILQLCMNEKDEISIHNWHRLELGGILSLCFFLGCIYFLSEPNIVWLDSISVIHVTKESLIYIFVSCFMPYACMYRLIQVIERLRKRNKNYRLAR